jgi:hypothetical protein
MAASATSTGTAQGLVPAIVALWQWLTRQLQDAPNDSQAAGLGSQADGGRDAVLVLDCSGSMKETDWKPDRHRGAKDAARAYIQRLGAEEPGARVAIVAFSSSAEIACGLTPVRDQTALLYAIERLSPGGKTNMRAALKLALKLLDSSRAAKQVVFLTDGLNTERDPEDVAARLREIATVECVGIGDRTEIDEALLCRIASPHADGRPRYRWIGDPESLTAHFRKLAGHISRD